MSSTSFRDSALYPVVFMLVVSVAFVGVLAAMFRFSEQKIEAYKREQYERMILALCADSLAAVSGQSVDEIIASYPDSYNNFVKPMDEGSQPRRAYAVNHQERLLAWVFDIGGKGLWGSIRALVATTPEADRIIALAIYEQMETPGLGARIGEPKFLGQFRRKLVIQEGKAVDFELIPEDQSPTADNQVNQVTGATITSNSVLKMLREEISLIHASLKQEEER